MKKVVISICAVAVVAITAINLNLVQNDLSSVNLSLANIMALARGESGKCSVCGKSFDGCTCGAAVTCDTGNCSGGDCHEITEDPNCHCTANGDPYHACYGR